MKLNRKWVLVIALVLSVAAATAGTLAYLTDRDTEVNTFTLGNVDIEVEEDYEQDSPLLPGVEVDKEAGVKNVHKSSDAWVWMTVSVPEELDEYITLEWLDGYEGEKIADQVQDGYVSYVVKHPYKLQPGTSTPKFLQGVTLSEKVDYQNGKYVVVDGGKIVAELDTLEDLKVIVDGFATQTEGFDTVDAAYTAYTKQWGGLKGGMSTGTPIDTAEGLLDALKNGTSDDIVYTGSDPVVIDSDLNLTGTANINLGGAELKFENGAKIVANNGSNLTITDAEIVSDGSGTIFEVTNGSVVTLGEGAVIEDVATADGSSLFNMYDYTDETSKVVLDGAEITGNNNNGKATMFSVGYGTELVIEDGTVISGNAFSGQSSNGNPYALIVVSTRGVVTMNGGEITGNSFNNRALINLEGGQFILNGGEITANEYAGTEAGRGLIRLTNRSVFEMNGGEITGNTIPGSSGAVLNVTSGTATISGGTIKDNSAESAYYDPWGGNVTVESGATVQ